MRRRLERDDSVDYQTLRSNEVWADHQLRSLVTAAAIAWLKPTTAVDPACGDGSILFTAHMLWPIHTALLGDISAANVEHVSGEFEYITGERKWFATKGSVEDTLVAVEPSDVIVLTEILEHLEDPDTILSMARKKAKHLVASSPEMRPGQVDQNPEHLWMFDSVGYRGMLVKAGWRVIQYTKLTFPTVYDFGIWVCS